VFFKSDTNLEPCGAVDVDGVMHVPLEALYAARGELHVKPRDEK